MTDKSINVYSSLVSGNLLAQENNILHRLTAGDERIAVHKKLSKSYFVTSSHHTMLMTLIYTSMFYLFSRLILTVLPNQLMAGISQSRLFLPTGQYLVNTTLEFSYIELGSHEVNENLKLEPLATNIL